MKKYDFLDQKEGEEIVLVIRQHAWVFFPVILQIIAIIVLAVMVSWFAKSSNITSWATIIAILIAIYLVFRTWFMWNSRVYIITDDRLISVDQKGWFNHSVSEANLENILFINHEVKGPIKTIFNFGDVRIRASGVNEDELVFFNVTNPYDIQQIIVKVQKQKTGSREQNNKNTQEKIVLR
jgi:uncharacterized membrane protein YdbT with pleckstrin-like domain